MKDDTFKKAFFECLDETFDLHHGIYLDEGTSLFPTLEGITAAEASHSAGTGCASLAAQVAHVTFYLEVLERHMLTGDAGKVDWRQIWRTVHDVTPGEWTALTQQLHERASRVRVMLAGIESWDDERAVSGALAILTHTAYHLGSLRQALGAIRSTGQKNQAG